MQPPIRKWATFCGSGDTFLVSSIFLTSTLDWQMRASLARVNVYTPRNCSDVWPWMAGFDGRSV
eukprot:3066861-Heterocapsa_arctica.AAC.1